MTFSIIRTMTDPLVQWVQVHLLFFHLQISCCSMATRLQAKLYVLQVHELIIVLH